MWKAIKLLGMVCLLGTAVLWLCLFVLANESQAGSGVLCVVPPGEPTGPFAACDEVFTEIQDAVDTAVGSEEIWVAAGVYTDVHAFPSHWWTQQIVLITKTLTIRGGYVSPFNEPPDFTGNPTVLDAQGQARVLYLPGPEATIEGLHLTGGGGELEGNGVYIGGGATVTLSQNTIYDNVGLWRGGGVSVNSSRVVLDRNVIRNNLGSINGTDVKGGGVYLFDSQAVLTRNRIISNTAVITASDDAYGGGIYIIDSQLTMTANVISGNVAAANGSRFASGGGVYIGNSTISVISNTIAGNTALDTGSGSTVPSSYGFGGGMNIGNSQGIISHNVVTGNRAVADHADYGEGGGLIIGGNQPLTLTGNTIEDNMACASECRGEGLGGGLFLGLGNDPPVTAVITLNNNDIRNNVAAVSATSGMGGGLFIYGHFNDSLTAVHMTDNDIWGNTGIISGLLGAGGGVFIGVQETVITLTGNRVMGNSAAVTASLFGLGGGLNIYGGQQQFNNNRIINNVATQNGTGYGGGLNIGFNNQTQLVNTVLNDNHANTNGSAVAMVGSDSILSMYHSTIARNQGSGGSAVWLAAQSVETGNPINNLQLMMTNTILVSHTTAISVSGGNTATLKGVLWFNTPVTVTAGVTATVNVANQLTGNPLFAADGYHLTTGSAAIRAGVPSGIAQDIDNEGRPSANPSLGADEYWPFKRYFSVVFRQ